MAFEAVGEVCLELGEVALDRLVGQPRQGVDVGRDPGREIEAVLREEIALEVHERHAMRRAGLDALELPGEPGVSRLGR